MRSCSFLVSGACLLALAASGCRDGAPAEPPPPEPISVPAAAAANDAPGTADPSGDDPEVSAAEEVPPPDPGDEPTLPDDPMDPRRFVGFSEDESRFAYGAWSRGARSHLFTVIESATGRRVVDFPLDSEETLGRARRLLEEGGFSPAPADHRAALLSDEALQIEVEEGDVRVWLVQEGARARLEPPATAAEATRRLRRVDAGLWGFSPHGTYVAVRLVEDQGEVLGRATTFYVLSVPNARVALQ